MEQNIILTPLQSALSYIFYYKKRQELLYPLSYYFPDNFDEPVFEVSNISEDIVDSVDYEEWIDLFRNKLDFFFAEHGINTELEIAEEINFHSWIYALKALVRRNNLNFDQRILEIELFIEEYKIEKEIHKKAEENENQSNLTNFFHYLSSYLVVILVSFLITFLFFTFHFKLVSYSLNFKLQNTQTNLQ